jgi:WD40 repeat protein
MPDVFVSYSRRDAEFVTRLTDDLTIRGKEVWIDVGGIRDAEVFPVALRRAIEGSDAFLFVISPDSVQSEYCEQEVTYAAELNKRIVPLALRPVPDQEIPAEIRFRNWIPVGEDTAADRVIGAIETDLKWEQQHTRLTLKALEWDTAGRDRSFLLRGADLQVAEQWLAGGANRPIPARPTALQQEYLLAARQAASRRQRTLVGGSLVVAGVAVALLIFALISRGQAVSAETNAKSQALAAVSATQQTVDPERAVLLAMAAVRTKTSSTTMFALRAAIDTSTIRYRLPAAGTQGCGAPVVAYDPAPQSNVLAEGLCDGKIVFADSTTGRVERQAQPGNHPVTVLAYTADGSGLVTTDGVRMDELDPMTGAVRTRSPIVPGLSIFALDPRMPVVAAVGHGELDFWNMVTGRVSVVRPKNAQAYGEASSIAYSPDGSRVAIAFNSLGSGGPGLVVVDVQRGRIIGSRSTPSGTVAYSPNGRELAVGELLPAGGSVVMLNPRSLAPVHKFSAVQDADVEPTTVAFSPDGSQLAYGFADGTAGLVAATTGQTVFAYSGDNAIITDESFSPDGRLLATGSGDGTVRAWRTGGLALLHAHIGDYLGDVEPDSGGFVSLANPGTEPGQGVVAERWHADGQPAGRPLVLSATPNVGASFLGADGRLAVVVTSADSNAASGVVHVWNVAERRVVRTLPLTLPSGNEPVVSPDGQLIAMNVQAGTGASPTSPGNDAEVLDLRTGRQRVLASDSTCSEGWRGFAFNRSSTLLAAGTFCGGKVSVWNLASGRRVGGSFGLSGGELAWIAFNPNGRHIAAASWNGTIRVSPVPVTGSVTTLTENTKGVPMVAYSPSGRYLASAGLDHTVRIFDADTLSELRVIAQPDATTGVTFTGDSLNVLSWGADNNVRMWDACTDCENPRALLALGQSRVTRQLTEAERREFGVS